MNTKHGVIPSFNALYITACVCVHIPSRTSMIIKPPSHNRIAVETSEEKSICPGESIKLIRYSSDMLLLLL